MTADTTAAPPRVRRPVTVTIAIVLVYISGISSVVLGTFVLLSRYQAAADAVLPVSLLGSAIILVGLLSLAIASGLSRGSRFARVLITIYIAAQIALQVTTIVVSDEWDPESIAQAVAAVLVFAAVWTPPGSRYFVAQTPAAP
ncbi:hypothetical protein [Microbacterium sp. CJ88]|uniref:hypothetical protein n=1 Tax=Microbacterium sp. CJ88 TaxID=3445672 RepID=UPI003F659AB3